MASPDLGFSVMECVTLALIVGFMFCGLAGVGALAWLLWRAFA